MAEPQITIHQDKVVEFCRRNQIRSISLFGSVLREDFGPDSDIDVLVEFDPEARIGFMALGRMQRELAELLGRPVDLVPREGLKPQIRDSVLGTAQVLYAA
jgi:predicted nucleotidyltransferase